MSKTLFGDAAAYLGKTPEGKGIYRKIGVAYKDDKFNSISIKIDCLPLPGSEWKGWINLFEVDENGRSRPRERNNPEPEVSDPQASKKATKRNPF